MAMDNIYPPCYEEITNIKSTLNTFREHLGAAKTIPVDDAEIRSAMNFNGSEDEFYDLQQSISIDHLAHSDDIRPTPYDPSNHIVKQKNDVHLPKEAFRLNTVATRVKRAPDMHYGNLTRYMKYNKYFPIHIPIDKSAASDLQLNEELLITVRVYEPFRYKVSTESRLKPKLSQRFIVLGSQLLTALRDRIYCQCKFGPFYDISCNPKKPEPSAETKAFDHGFFYIHNTFYNDTRQPTVDYSEVIRNWSATQPDFGEFYVDKMETTQFLDLTIRLGSPCVYQHHGNCEHLFTFSDIRLISSEDSLVRSNYPMMNMISSPKPMFCNICGRLEASVIVTDSTIHIQDPAYLCQICFELCHYIDGKKVGEFRAYRFYGNKPVMEIGK